MPAPDTDRADGLVLCGGRGRRVGGADKGLLSAGEQQAVDRALDLLRPLCARLYISANRHLETYASRDGARVVSDLRDGYAGPLAAFEAVARLPLAPLLLVLPVDLPLLDPQIPLRLLQSMRAPETRVDAICASDGERDQYLCACVRSECLADAAVLLERGEHRVGQWLAGLRHRTLQFDGELAASLRNFNSAAAWESLA